MELALGVYCIEFYSHGKWIETFRVEAINQLDAMEYGLGKFADMNHELAQGGDPVIEHDEIRVVTDARAKEAVAESIAAKKEVA